MVFFIEGVGRRLAEEELAEYRGGQGRSKAGMGQMWG